MAIVKANYRPRAKAAGIGRSVAYYSWREGEDRPRDTPRTWHAADGRELDYDEARAEVSAGAQDASYTYRVVLSTRDVELQEGDYREVLDGHFSRWYFVEHHGGEHPHAHAIALSDHRLDAGELRDMRAELAAHEQAREREIASEQGQEQRQGLAQEIVAPAHAPEIVWPDAFRDVAGDVTDSLADEALADAMREDDQHRSFEHRHGGPSRRGDRDGRDAGDYDRS